MKSSIIISLILVLGSFQRMNAQGPTLDSFYKEGCKWTEYVGETFFYGYKNTAWTLTIGDDTMINSVNYKLLEKDSIGKEGYWNGSHHYDTIIAPTQLIGAIRTVGKQVYYYSFSTNIENIIYNFDVVVGDTLQWKAYNKVVLAIDSIQISDGRYVKKIIFMTGNSMADDYWIEGIGSHWGFVSGHYWLYPYGNICYDAISFTYHFPNDFSNTLNHTVWQNCFANLHLLEVEKMNALRHLDIYPNPLTSEYLTLSGSELISSMNVYDVAGMLQLNFNTQVPDKIYLPLPAGLYIVKMELKNGESVIKKLLKE